MNIKLTSMDNSAKTSCHKIRVLATRPQQQVQSLLQQLQDRGYEAMSFPCLAIEPVSTDSAMAQQCSVRATEIDHYQHIIVVSANAVAFWLPWVNRYWTKLPIDPHWWAIGEATCYRLQAFDIHARRPYQGYAPRNESETLGIKLAEALLSQGADAILQSIHTS